ncbi:MAG: TonB-dependent receptor domain-containing protein, partial [Chitinophagales bacterium]
TVNGKFSNQSAADVLAMIPANMIERIEVISAPSAIFDAEGKAGIINIVTKSDQIAGWGFLINGNFSSINPARYGGDFSVYKNGKLFNAFLSGNFRQYNIDGERIGEIRTIFNDTVTFSPSSGERILEEKLYGIRAGATFAPSKHHVFSGAAYYGYRENIRIANLNYQEYTSQAIPLNLYTNFDTQSPDRIFLNENVFTRTGEFLTLNLDYAFTFSNASKLSIAGAYEHSVLGGPLTNQDTDTNTGEITLMERSDEVSPLDAWRLQADYKIAINTNWQLESGAQWRTVHHQGNFNFERLNLNTQIWEPDPEFIDTLDLTQDVFAGYLQIGGKFENFSFNAGLRAEQMDRNLTHVLDSVPAIVNEFDLFPSVQAFWKMQKEQSVKLSFAKRINRPTTKSLAPFQNHRHSEAIWIGDPYLLPEISYNIELGYEKKFNSIVFTVLTYYNLTENMIFRVNDIYSRVTLYTIATNAGNSKSAGTEISSDWQISPNIRLYLSGNMYKFYLYDLVNAEASNTESLNYNFYGNFSYRFLPKFKLEWNASYISRTVTAQGDDSPLFLSDISLEYSITNRFRANVKYQNVFNSNRQTIHTENNNFTSTTDYVKYDNILLLSVSYKLNNLSGANKNVKTEYGEKDF